MVTNPVIRGFNPDPSVCFHDGVYYAAVSTFEYFPGVTVWSSRDLVNWRYEDSVLKDGEHLPLRGAKKSTGGIYAPTLRYADGEFWMVTTNKNLGWNFLVHSPSIHGPWSDIVKIREKGIDPSLFFTDDGRCFYTSNGVVDGVRGILGFYINPRTGERLSPERILTTGISHASTEAPHIYFRDGWYYLVFAEGGTGMGHHEEVMRSRSLEGEWEWRGRPILSHVARKDYIIQATGHAELVEMEDGRWAALFLGIRKPGKPELHQLGRETFLSSVTWEDGWPVIGNDGYVDIEIPFSGVRQEERGTLLVDFREDLSSLPLMKLREERAERYVLDRERGVLTLLGDTPISSPEPSCVMLMVRQTDFSSRFTAVLDTLSFSGRGGVVAWYSENYHYAIYVEDDGRGAVVASLVAVVHGLRSIVSKLTLERQAETVLEIVTSPESYSFHVSGKPLGTLSYAGLSTEAMMEMTFTGTMLGIFSEEGEIAWKDGFSLSTL